MPIGDMQPKMEVSAIPASPKPEEFVLSEGYKSIGIQPDSIPEISLEDMIVESGYIEKIDGDTLHVSNFNNTTLHDGVYVTSDEDTLGTVKIPFSRGKLVFHGFGNEDKFLKEKDNSQRYSFFKDKNDVLHVYPFVFLKDIRKEGFPLMNSIIEMKNEIFGSVFYNRDNGKICLVRDPSKSVSEHIDMEVTAKSPTGQEMKNVDPWNIGSLRFYVGSNPNSLNQLPMKKALVLYSYDGFEQDKNIYTPGEGTFEPISTEEFKFLLEDILQRIKSKIKTKRI